MVQFSSSKHTCIEFHCNTRGINQYNDELRNKKSNLTFLYSWIKFTHILDWSLCGDLFQA